MGTDSKCEVNVEFLPLTMDAVAESLKVMSLIIRVRLSTEKNLKN